MSFQKKHILDIGSLSIDEITHILNTADTMKEISERPVKKVPTLRGKTIILFFHEPSTRTKVSFDIAAKRLSADSISISSSGSSMVKGETLIDTGRNLQAMNPDIVVMRHSSSGASNILSKALDTSVINAGDGMHAHPSQSLLDMMSIREIKGDLKGLKVAMIGDIAHSRVARSNMEGLKKMGAQVIISGPPTMIPIGIESYGVKVTYDVNEAVKDADVIIMLRIQKERQENFLFSTEREYSKTYGLSLEKLQQADSDVLIMHPGPMNRGVEITNEVADGPYSIILDQVKNGVALRMALFYLLAGGS